MRFLLLLFVTAAAAIAQNGQIQQPKGAWQKPGEIQPPKGSWQKPRPIQVPKGIQAIRAQDDPCEHRLVVAADALFDFDRATLGPDARETLSILGPMVQKAGKHPILIEGHTDAVGTESYNQDLSERRARAVRAWLLEQHYLDGASVQVQGFGKARPAEPNTKPDGSDNPEGRQKNRRVEVAIGTCK
ncbi:MAG TPA: OmpA family protein [Bryobacteraceae bacterium]|nr:OmpA family protein [Bryobacteraceae bacterium]